MPTELVWSNQARTDLLDIYVMIGLEQPAAASAISTASKPRLNC
jgi:toxin ParE1/3/4